MMGFLDFFRRKPRSKKNKDSLRRESVSSLPKRNAVEPYRSRSPSPAAPRKRRPRKGRKKMQRRTGGRLTTAKFDKQRRMQKSGRRSKHVFPDESVSNLARALKGDEWEKLAYSFGFLAQGVSHFTGRASSSQNIYSQACLMLTTWRDQTHKEQIIPRLTAALQKIRRHDLALKIGLELGVIATTNLTEEKEIPRKTRKMLEAYSADKHGPPYKESKLIIGNDRISFLARQLLKREEWYRLAFALGFLPDEVSQIVASASSSQNLYTQAHMMLMIWRDRTSPNQLVPKLRAAFIRIRRHDLVDLLNIGAISGADDMDECIDHELKNLNERIKKKSSLGASIAEKFKQLQF